MNTNDTRPSIFGGFDFNLPAEEQKAALKEFKLFYITKAFEVTWDNEKSVFNSDEEFDSEKERIDAAIENIETNKTENCLGFSYLLQRKLHELKIPAVLIWVERKTKKEGSHGHCLVAYQVNGLNYVADLCSITKGCNQYRVNDSFIFDFPMEEYLAAYARTGYIAVKYGSIKFAINFFKEYDGIFKHLRMPVNELYYNILPFFSKKQANYGARKKQEIKMNILYRPTNFESVGFSKDEDEENIALYNAPPELIKAYERKKIKFDKQNRLGNYFKFDKKTFLVSERENLKKLPKIREQLKVLLDNNVFKLQIINLQEIIKKRKKDNNKESSII